MGFIMKKGVGTEEILCKLDEVFVTNVSNTAKERNWLLPTGPGGGSLLAAAVHFKVMPTDERHQKKWKKWLRWLEKKQPGEHAEIRDNLYLNLSEARPIPTYCDWAEDSGATGAKSDHRRVSGGGGPVFAKLLVTTRKADDLPDPDLPSPGKKAKKVKGNKSKGKKAAKPKAKKKKA